MREQNAFYIMYVWPILRLEPIEYVYLEFNVATAYSQSKQAVMSFSDDIQTVNLDVNSHATNAVLCFSSAF